MGGCQSYREASDEEAAELAPGHKKALPEIDD